MSAAGPADPASSTAERAGSNTFYTAPSLGTGVRGIELDRCYEGDYVAGRRHGFGSYTYPNSFFKYEGQWVNGKKHGLGKLSMRDGAYYEGEFVEGEIVGQGTRRFANGDVYIGTFEMGEMHGFGVMRLTNGDTYQGPLVHNAFQGVGVYTFANGDVFEGDFVNHKRQGKGVVTCADGSRYEGSWADNQRTGYGECTYADGSWYKGEWERGLYQGQGEWFQARSGLTYRGQFQAGAPALIPTGLTITWLSEEDPKKAAGGRKAPSTARGAGWEPEVATPLPVVLGEPCPFPLTISAQLQERLPPPTSPAPGADARGGATAGGKKPSSAHAAPAVVPVINQPPQPGHVWRTADMEWGRQVNLTLHAESPRPLPSDRLLRVLVVNTLMPDGSTRVRLLLSTTNTLPPALPLSRVEGQIVASVQVGLEAGKRVVEGLVIGSPEDEARIAQPNAMGYLVATSPGSRVAPGFVRVALPEPKPPSKKPGGK
ncbi:hypothetical protein VOLCADRAFT_81711 [Volvox carteri f. nagariensis]|uniref:Uncharacterized protein mot46 n=1 Tax=Volvox carteri f. nagariensis TaxID=3068 RepID=D8U054_VOLCA|nr:uncharacterized protein VOLCADRAFT_81711 [Volvox carteri f. nagariensis]EFJ46878.1 hypothetical protein VOLCADRAFT_81711 [Volvox carteri f. nagariensis]|eukprot:XP_002952087.1 hypothetical protein VOLCADRAFT_81711 [Volvox carteri f. nagariensis]